MNKYKYTILLLLILHTYSYACSCIARSHQNAYDNSDWIFQGNVVQLEHSKVTFAIEKIWKGTDQGLITIPYTPQSVDLGNGFTEVNTCGLKFSSNTQYLISYSGYSINVCSHYGRKLSNSTDDIIALDQISKPYKPSEFYLFDLKENNTLIPFEHFNSNIESSYFDHPGIHLINSSTDWGELKNLEYFGFPDSINIDYTTESALIITRNGDLHHDYVVTEIRNLSGNIYVHTENRRKDNSIEFRTVISPVLITLKTEKLSGNIIEQNTYIPFEKAETLISHNRSSSPIDVSQNDDKIVIQNHPPILPESDVQGSGGGCLLKEFKLSY